MWLVARVVAHHGKDDLARRQIAQALLRRDQFAVGREDRFDADQIEFRNPGGTKRQLERVELFAMLADTFCEEDALRKRPHLVSNLPIATCEPISSVFQTPDRE